MGPQAGVTGSPDGGNVVLGQGNVALGPAFTVLALAVVLAGSLQTWLQPICEMDLTLPEQKAVSSTRQEGGDGMVCISLQGAVEFFQESDPLRNQVAHH